MDKRIKNIFTSVALVLGILLAAPSLGAQTLVKGQVESYKFDFGGGLGMSGYLGDANTSNLFAHPGLAANLSFRYLIDNRWALRTMLNLESLSGNSADMENVFPGGETYEFKSWIYDLGVRAEFNFFNYGIGSTYKQLRRWSPYMALGLGAVLSNCEGKTFVAASLPMSVGIKYKLRPRVNLSAEFTIAKAFGDHLDGEKLSDLYTIKSSFLKNTDWYSSVMVSISYEFGPRCSVCNRLE